MLFQFKTFDHYNFKEIFFLFSIQTFSHSDAKGCPMLEKLFNDRFTSSDIKDEGYEAHRSKPISLDDGYNKGNNGQGAWGSSKESL